MPSAIPETPKAIKSDFKCDVLKVLSRSEPDRAGNRTELRVVKWERAAGPAVEKRRIWRSKETGEERPRKLVGLGIEDVRLVVANAEEIFRLLGRSG